MTTPSHPRVRVGVCITEFEKILLCEHRRGDRTVWMLPGGGVDWGESLVDAALRECKEEVCLDVTLNEIIVVAETRNAETQKHNLHIVFDTIAWTGHAEVGTDPDVCGLAWHGIEYLHQIDLYPPIAEQLRLALARLTPSVRYSGQLWHDVF